MHTWLSPRIRIQTGTVQRLAAGLLALAALVAGLSAWVLTLDAARTEPVVLVVTAIAPGERIQPEHVTTIQAPIHRPAALVGIADAALVVGQYARVSLSPNQLLTRELVQPQPLGDHIFVNGALPAERLTLSVYELPRPGLSSLTSQDRINVLVLVDATRGHDVTFRAGTMDRPGSGPRVVRVLRGLNVLAVNERTAFLEVTPAQSAYLWALQSSGVPFVGELAATADAPLGVLSAAATSLTDLEMEASPRSQEAVQP